MDKRKVLAIMNADDFGLTAGINRGIIESHRDGILTSASLMATGSAFNEAVRLARAHPGLSIGVHLTLVEGKPILPPEKIPSLVAANGHFFETPGAFLMRWLAGRIRQIEVMLELEAQVTRVSDYGISIDKLDSHMHLHLLPGIFQTVLNLGKRHHIRGVRLPRGEWSWRHFDGIFSSPKQGVLEVLSHLQARQVAAATLYCPDYFRGMAESGRLTEDALLRILSALKPGVTEVMVHPGYRDRILKRWPRSWRYKREEALTLPSLKRQVRNTPPRRL